MCSAAVFVWDDTGDQPFDCRYYKQFWHLPRPRRPLSDFELPNGLGYTVREPQRVYDLRYRDPDDDDVSFDLTFTAVMDPLPPRRRVPTAATSTSSAGSPARSCSTARPSRSTRTARARPLVGIRATRSART